MIRIAGSAKPRLSSRVGFIQQQASWPKRPSYHGNQGAMQVAEYQDGAIALFLKRFFSGYFQIDLPCGDHGATFAGNPFGFSETLCGSITADHIQPSLTNQNPIMVKEHVSEPLHRFRLPQNDDQIHA